MSFVVNKSDGTPLVELQDGEYDSIVSALTLIGKGAPLYAERMNENLVSMLENFSSSTAPRAPLRGQLWHDISAQTIKLFTGTQWYPLVVGDPSTAIPGGIVGGGKGQTLAATLYVKIDSTRSVLAIIASGNVIAAVSHSSIAKAAMPASITVGTDTLAFQSRFSAGLKPGITLAEDAQSYLVTGTVTRAQLADNAISATSAQTALTAQLANVATTATRANAVVGSVDARGASLLLDDNQVAQSKVSGLSTALANSVIPTGAIIVWYGTHLNVPYGWAMCDGNNGTPDLRGRMVVGASMTDPSFYAGWRAGSANHTHVTDNSGAHTHTGSTDGTALTVAQMPAHNHLNGVVDKNDDLFNHGGAQANPIRGGSIDGNSSSGTREGYTTSTGSGQAHSHTVTLSNSGAHSHNVQQASNMPPYHALFYIMKIL